MARFRATIQGQRGSASRLGGPSTGISARVNGWNSGVYITGEALGESDRFWITATGGSNARSTERPLGYVEVRNGEPVFVAYKDAMRHGSKAKAS